MKRTALNKIILFFLFCGSVGGAVAQTSAVNNPAAADECGCEFSPVPDVLATVNGIKITKADLTPATVQKIKELQQEVTNARKRELDLLINSALLEAEAKKRGVTTAKLLEEEVVRKVKEPTEAQAQGFYDQNKARLTGDFLSLKSQIISYLRDQRQREEAKNFADRMRAAATVKKLVEFATPPATPADRDRILAYVNSSPIRSSNVENSLGELILDIQKRVYQMRLSEVEMKINDILLEKEAQKRNMTAKALLDAETTGKAAVVTDADAQNFYNQNKERINGEFAQTKAQIIQYLKDQEQTKAQKAFADRLRAGAQIQVFLTAPTKRT